MDNPKIMKIASIGIGIVIAVLLLVVGFKVFSGIFTRAADFEPRDVVVSTIAENSAKLSWTTGTDTQGVVEYGTSPTALNFFAPEPQKLKTHSQDLTLLSPNTTYYFQIRISDTKYDNGGVPWTFTTKAAAESVVTSPVLSPTTPSVAATPTPIPNVVQKLQVGTQPQGCSYTDCTQVKANLGKGCTTQDYWKCLKK